jgi:uncharacterized glyoxalase superfamily protein PhnB
MSEAQVRPSVVPILWYDKPREAIAWLGTAFGLEPVMVVAGDDERSVIHSELTFGNGGIYVVGPPTVGEGGASPLEIGGRNTQHVHLNLTDGLDGHCARARAAGARIEREPADQPYGDRVYTCVDPEGHIWSFAQPLRAMTVAEREAATGRRIDTPA